MVDRALDWGSGGLSSYAAAATLAVCLGACQSVAVVFSPVRCGVELSDRQDLAKL